MILVLLLVGGGIYLVTRNSSSVAKNSPSPTAKASATAKASPSASPSSSGSPSTSDTAASSLAKLQQFCGSSPSTKGGYDQAAVTDFCAFLPTVDAYHQAADVQKDIPATGQACDSMASSAQQQLADLSAQQPTSSSEQQADSQMKQGYADIAAGSTAMSKGITDKSTDEYNTGHAQWAKGFASVAGGLGTLGH